MRIKNVSGGILVVTDIINVDGSKGLTLQINCEADVFHGEDQRSAELKSFIVGNMVKVVGDESSAPVASAKKEEAKSAPVAPKAPAPAPKVEKKKPEVIKSTSAKKAKGKK